MPIHPNAVVHENAKIHESADIGPFVTIEEDVEIGENCVIMPGAVIRAHTKLHKGVRIHAHVVIGDDPQYVGFDPTLKTGVEVGEGSEIREYATINRSIYEGKYTTVGKGVMLMISAHLGHDCIIGDGVVIANNTMLGGHVEVGPKAFISANVVIHQFCRISRLVMVGGMVGINRDVPPFILTSAGGGPAYLFNLNVIGMRRAGIEPKARKQIKEAFNVIFNQNKNLSKGLEAIYETMQSWDTITPEAQEFVDFCGEKSKRGLLRARRRPFLNPHPDDVDDAQNETDDE